MTDSFIRDIRIRPDPSVICGQYDLFIRIVTDGNSVKRLILSGCAPRNVTPAINGNTDRSHVFHSRTEAGGAVSDDEAPGSSHDAAGAPRILQKACSQLKEYFSGRRRRFTISLCLEGSPFFLSVWNALAGIPYGLSASYGQIARELHKPGSARAVGTAAHNNPLPIFIPCHRLVRADGKIGGYAAGPEVKQILLSLEAHYSNT